MLPLKSARVTYPYGVKNKRYRKGFHTGIDLASTETPIYASVPGTVIEARYALGKGADPAGWGNYVIIRTCNGLYDLIHAHLAAVNVVYGQTIKEGTVLGIMGSTGNSSGPHLHFEVRRVPWGSRDEINPAIFLGIENKKGAIERLSEEKKGISPTLILCNPGPDERAAAYLADYLKASVSCLADASAESIYCAERIYVIGSTAKVSPQAINIVGTDRYDTCQKVLAICQRH
ncbi:M23 family metallopeptidase [Dehalobacter sp. DCM]|uniref:M23 family metallopeptidase n=1 Tax=Dehalobacter sp. DCM TaxID=2907827 RepID=UPI0030818F0C|nr:M23 family metallopeptidase [Dehalobacter sp. DCM]